MQSLRSSVLIIHHPRPEAVSFGADFLDLDESIPTTDKQIAFYPVVVLPASLALNENLLDALSGVDKNSPPSQMVIVLDNADSASLLRILEKRSAFRILKSFDDTSFEQTVQEALEEYNLLKQNTQMIRLMNEQNDRLRRLSEDLEDRVEKRQRHLEESKEKLIATNHRVAALHRALVAIHRAQSVGELERLINEALGEALQLKWTRILFSSQLELEVQQAQARKILEVHVSSLMRGKDRIGRIHFAREAHRPFERDETQFLAQVADAVALAIDRMTTLDQTETLKVQWEATFDAILSPVAIISKDRELVRLNHQFANQAGLKPQKLIGKKCFTALFGRTTPCPNCQLGSKFQLSSTENTSNSLQIYDVYSQPIQLQPHEGELFVHLYHDVSPQMRLERQIVDSAKMAELGTIGSSIAHELNNPLGGMLSFLQLIKIDLKGEEHFYQDILDMESGTKRCRDIIQNLLGFSRKSDGHEPRPIDLYEVLLQAMKITELQSRSLGIQVDLSQPEKKTELVGKFNLLAQAIQHFLQVSLEMIALKRRTEPRHRGRVQIRIVTEPEQIQIVIQDDGAERFMSKSAEMPTENSSSSTDGFGLAIAKQILDEHRGRVEFSTTSQGMNQAILSISRLDPVELKDQSL